MESYITRQSALNGAIILIILTVMAAVFMLSDTVVSGVYDSNDTSTAKVNVTNSAPVITNLVLAANLSHTNIELRPGVTTTVFCNATLTDNNGFNDLNATNATLYYYLNASNAVDENSVHYTNDSCRIDFVDFITGKAECTFKVWYYAQNGSWLCNMTVRDQNVTGQWNITSNTTGKNISVLLALNSSDFINYGTMEVFQNSTVDTNVSVQNLGNVMIDINVWGYGRPSASVNGDNLSMVCDVGNISIGMQRYNVTGADGGLKGYNDTGLYINLSGVPSGISHADFNLSKTTNETGSYQKTTWRIGVPQGARGNCNGTVVFAALIG